LNVMLHIYGPQKEIMKSRQKEKMFSG
jgi:hypothetical protein